MNNAVKVEIEKGVALVTLNRSDKMNALNADMFNGIAEAADQIKSNAAVRAVVIHGSGDNFCAGLDMSMFGVFSGENDLIGRTHGISNLFQYVAWAWNEVPVPVIAAIEGYCFGGGLQIACGADMRYVHPKTKMSIMEIKWGLVPDMAGTQLWKNFVKQDLLRELTYTGEIFSGEKANEYGFATRLTDTPLQLAMETATLIASKNPEAIRANKVIINHQNDVTSAQGLMTESELQEAIINSPNQTEAVMANMEKREPNFSDPEL